MNDFSLITTDEYYQYFNSIHNLETVALCGLKSTQLEKNGTLSCRSLNEGLLEKIRGFLEALFNEKIRKKNQSETDQKMAVIRENIRIINQMHKKLETLDFTFVSITPFDETHYCTLKAGHLYREMKKAIDIWNENLSYSFFAFLKRGFNTLLGFKIPIDERFNLFIHSNGLKGFPKDFLDRQHPLPDMKKFAHQIKEVKQRRWQKYDETELYKLILGGGIFRQMNEPGISEEMVQYAIRSGEIQNRKLINQGLKNASSYELDFLALEDYIELVSLISLVDSDGKKYFLDEDSSKISLKNLFDNFLKNALYRAFLRGMMQPNTSFYLIRSVLYHFSWDLHRNCLNLLFDALREMAPAIELASLKNWIEEIMLFYTELTNFPMSQSLIRVNLSPIIGLFLKNNPDKKELLRVFCDEKIQIPMGDKYSSFVDNLLMKAN